MSFYNPEHYPDPTVYYALKKVAGRDAAKKKQAQRPMPSAESNTGAADAARQREWCKAL